MGTASSMWSKVSQSWTLLNRRDAKAVNDQESSMYSSDSDFFLFFLTFFYLLLKQFFNNFNKGIVNLSF